MTDVFQRRADGAADVAGTAGDEDFCWSHVAASLGVLRMCVFDILCEWGGIHVAASLGVLRMCVFDILCEQGRDVQHQGRVKCD